MKKEDNSIDNGLQELLNRTTADSSLPSAEQNDNMPSVDKIKTSNTHDIMSENTTMSKEEKSQNSAFRKLTGWEDNTSVNANLRAIIGGDILAGKWFQRHLLYLFALVIVAIFYVTNRYAHQNEIIDNRKLTLALEDRRLRAVVARSNLTEYMRRSNISKNLTDSTLKSSHTPFYYLQTRKK